MSESECKEVITVRVPRDILDRLPKPSLAGVRARWIRDAIREKLDREEKARRRHVKT